MTEFCCQNCGMDRCKDCKKRVVEFVKELYKDELVIKLIPFYDKVCGCLTLDLSVILYGEVVDGGQTDMFLNIVEQQ